MRKFKFNKLVRDKIPDQWRREGNAFESETLGNKRYIEELKKKLLEEVMEANEETGQAALASELSDVQEVMDALIAALGLKPQDITKLQAAKRRKVGSFAKRIYVKTLTIKDGHPWLPHFRKHKKKYPEIKN